MSALHTWHRDIFTRSTEATVHLPTYSTPFGGTFPRDDDGSALTPKTVRLKSARAVVCQRVVNAMAPAEWAHAQVAFDTSDEGQALKDTDPSVRREHCELWLLRALFECDHPELVAGSEYALVSVLAHHAATDKLAAHKARVVAHVRDGAPLGAEVAP